MNISLSISTPKAQTSAKPSLMSMKQYSQAYNILHKTAQCGYAPVIRLKIAISVKLDHIHADKTDDVR